MTSIAFLGLGAMGSRMAANLARAGHALTVWNRDSAKAAPLAAMGARVAATPGEAAAAGAVVIAMLRDDEASRRVWLGDGGTLAAMRPGAIAVECSTLSLAWVRELAGAARARGTSLLDAPVAGSLPQAEAGQLIFLAGGDAGALAQAEPILRGTGAAVHHAGGSGMGAAVKLAVNALLGIQVAAMAEIIGLLVQAGADPARAIEIIGSTPAASPSAKGAAAMMLAPPVTPLFTVDLVEKDFGYIAAAAGKGAPVAAAARAAMQAASARGLGGANLTSLVELYR
jgi:3-hydroxyisobutyrate dehydrogenase